MSFKFRCRGDVSEQSPQQEPFFQNTAGQQPSTLIPDLSNDLSTDFGDKLIKC